MSPQYFKDERKRYGFWSALQRLAVRRHLPLVGYVILTAWVAVTFNIERQHSNNNRKDLAQSAQVVLVQSCRHGNDLRGVLRRIVTNSLRQAKVAEQRGLISPDVLKINEVLTKDEIAQLQDSNCSKLYHTIK